MSALVINKNNLNEALNSGKTVLLDFYASWCGPCRTLSPIVDKIADENPNLLVGKINVEEEGELAKRFSVTSIPALFVMKDGKVAGKSTGVVSERKIYKLLES